MAATIVGTALFLILYFAGYWLPGRRRLWTISAITLLGIGFAPFNVGAAAFFIYAATLAGATGRPEFATRVLAALLTIIVSESLLLRLSAWFWAPAMILSVAVGFLNIYLAKIKLANRRLRFAQDEIEHLAQVAERERIARDLHDVLGHTLSVVILKSELASKLMGLDPERAKNEMRDVEQISREALTEVRHVISGYRALSLADELVRAHATLRAAGVIPEFSSDPVALSGTQETVLALALREALTNVVRHAGAHRLQLKLGQLDGLCRLEIHDDGCGGTQPEGGGIQGMRQRVEMLGGTLKRETTDGTRLTILLPLAKEISREQA